MINIREARKEDASKIVDYLNQVGGESDNLSFGLNEFHTSVEDEENFLEKIQEGKNDLVLIALDHGEIVSVLTLISYKSKRTLHRGSIGLSVRKDHWHQGVATKMLKQLMEYVNKTTLEIIELEVRSDNIYAIKLYEKFGFKKIGHYKKFMKIGSEYCDIDFMNLYL